jgi:hypothetical protein
MKGSNWEIIDTNKLIWDIKGVGNQFVSKLQIE